MESMSADIPIFSLGDCVMPRISVIIPIYNSSKTLSYTIQSIINQTFKDIEIILVNDGSTDNSGELCEELVKCDNRIHVYHQSNQGRNYALALGVEKAIGDYVSYIDSDDYALPSMYEKLYNAITESEADIVRGGFIFVPSEYHTKAIQLVNLGYFDELLTEWKVNNYDNKLYNLDSFRRDFLENKRKYLNTQLLIRKSILDIEELKSHHKVAADFFFWLVIFDINKDIRIQTLPDVVYLYFYGVIGSISVSEKNIEWWNSYLDVLNKQIYICKKYGITSSHSNALLDLTRIVYSKAVDFRRRGGLDNRVRKKTIKCLRQDFSILCRDNALSIKDNIGLLIFCISKGLFYFIQNLFGVKADKKVS